MMKYFLLVDDLLLFLHRLVFPTTLLLLISTPLFAQSAGNLDDVPIPMVQPTICFGMTGVAETEALEICDAIQLKQTVRARELAEQWLSKEPQLPAAQFAFSEVLLTIEGNMARALFHLNEAESLMDYSSLEESLESGNLQWHYLTLSQLSYVHQLMGDQIKSLDYLDKINEIFGQDVESFKGWSYIKLKDFDAARESANLVLESNDNERARARAWNTLCAVELASLAPIESVSACEKAINEENPGESESSTDTVYLSNAAEVSLSLLKIDEAEAYLDRATRYLNPDSVADPWIYKLYLTMNQGRFDDAKTALDRMLVWRDQQEPIVSAMNRAEHFLVSANFLLLAGYSDDAAKLTATALNQPDRNGSYSADDSQKDSYAALVNMMANRMELQILLEKNATASWFEKAQTLPRRLSLRLEAWRAERRAASLFAEFDLMQNRVRPYAPLDVHIPEWVEPELVSLMGTGVMTRILEQARSNGAFQLNDGYYFGYLTEIAAIENNLESVRANGQQALTMLPDQEVLLKARIMARIAEADWLLGNVESALAFYELAYKLDPSIIRRLASSLPVQIRSDGSQQSEQIAEYLSNSPRFNSADTGFILEINSQPSPSICLKSPSEDLLSCYAEASLENSTAETLTVELTESFHWQTFGLGYDISKAQRSMLLGSSVILSSQTNGNSQRNRTTILN